MKRFKNFVIESIEQEELDEAVEVRHDRYMRSHGKKASGGNGSWMFTHKAMGDVDHKNEKEVYSAPSGKFSDAKKAAQQWAKKYGHSTVYVMESAELDEGILKSYHAIASKPWSQSVKDKKGTAGEYSQIAKGKDFTVWTGYSGSLKKQAHYIIRNDKIIGSGWTMNSALKDAGLKDSDLIARSKFAQGSILNKGVKESVELDEKYEPELSDEKFDKIVSTRGVFASHDRKGGVHFSKGGKSLGFKMHPHGRAGAEHVHTWLQNMGFKKQRTNHFGVDYYKEEFELDEKLKASDDMGTWVKDFQKSDAPQFKGKSQKKRQQMAVAAKLSAERNESVEQIDEVSTEKLRDYASAALQDKNKAKADKRWKYAGKAMDKVADREVKAAHSRKYNKMEEVELDEKAYVSSLSPELGRKGSHDVIGKDGKVVKSYPYTKQGMKLAQKHLSKMKEEVELDEVLDTPKAMDSYKAKAKYSKERAASSAAAKILRGKNADGSRADHSPELKTMAKREKGLKMADKNAMKKTFKKLRGEEVELDEAKRDIYHQHMLKALGKSRLPKNHQYTSAIANNGDFVVKDGGGRTVGRIAKGDHNLKD